MSNIKLKEKFDSIIEYETTKSCFLKGNPSKKCLSTGYIYPYEDKKIHDRLTGQLGYIDVKGYLIKNDRKFYKDYRIFKELIHNGDINPKKEYRLLDYYVKPMNYNSLDIIYDFYEDNKIKCNIVHVGEKGSGKTAMQNCWLHENTDKLERNNIFWVRCDGHKLYRLWMEHRNRIIKKNESGENLAKEQLVNIQEYLDIQLIYVFSKYCTDVKRPFFRNILAKIIETNAKVDVSVSRRLTDQTQCVSLYSEIEQLTTTIKIKEKSQNKSYSYAFNHVMEVSLDTSQLEKRKWIDTSKGLQKFLQENNYKVLKILDGMDNISISDHGSVDYYKYMIQSAYQFIRFSPERNVIHYATTRERTYIDMLRSDQVQEDTNYYIDTHQINNECADFKTILKKRYKYAKDSSEASDSYYWSIANFIIKKVDKKTSDLHHNNVRTFLFNKSSLICQVYYRMKQLRGSPSKIPSHIKTLEIRNKFLNGRLFLTTNKEWHGLNKEKGLCCTNIFYYDKDKHQSNCNDQWYGLVKTRLLQIMHKVGSVSEDDIISNLNEILNYPIPLIEQAVRDLREYGMIDSKYSDTLYYKITEKGKKYLELSYTYIDTLYYYSLDCPLPWQFIESDAINVHNNKYRKRTGYPYATASTVTLFLLFLMCINNQEKDLYKKYMNGSKIKNKIVLKNIDLPFLSSEKIFNNLKGLMHEAIDSSDPKDYAKINNYFDKIIKLRDLSFKEVFS